jgi:RHH-type rel operon transcriptional repressor/antitoxin RelB
LLVGRSRFTFDGTINRREAKVVSARTLTLNVAEDTVAGLEKLARETGRSADQLAEEALARFIDYESWKSEKIRSAICQADAGDFATDDEMEEVFDRYRHAVDRSA